VHLKGGGNRGIVQTFPASAGIGIGLPAAATESDGGLRGVIQPMAAGKLARRNLRSKLPTPIWAAEWIELF
jgi:hypothetical protein